MAEKVVIGNAELWHGDCREVLPLLPRTVAIVSDPPYGIAYQHSGGGAGKHTRRNSKMQIANDDIHFDPAPLLQYDKVLIFGADHYANKLPNSGTWICWDKSCGVGPADSFADAEFAWSNFRVKRNVARFLWKGICSVKTGEQNGARPHPTTKPVILMKWCIQQAGTPKLVCDPFMGSGTTGVACMALGCNFVGVELERKYFDIACERIARAQSQARLDLGEPEPKPEHADLLLSA